MKAQIESIGKILLEISEKTTLYHRSEHKPPYKVGAVIQPAGTRHKEGHWLANKKGEQFLEDLRKEEFKGKPSRLNCVFTTVVPRTRFTGKGRLYVVKPVGKTHVADSGLIDDIDKADDYFERKQYATRYWKGELMGAGRDTIEVLCSKAKVVEVPLEKEEFFRQGDKVKLLYPIEVWWYGYDKSGNKQLPKDKIEKIVTAPWIEVVEKKMRNTYNSYTLKLKPGNYVITRLFHSAAMKRERSTATAESPRSPYMRLDISKPGVPSNFDAKHGHGGKDGRFRPNPHMYLKKI